MAEREPATAEKAKKWGRKKLYKKFRNAARRLVKGKKHGASRRDMSALRKDFIIVFSEMLRRYERRRDKHLTPIMEAIEWAHHSKRRQATRTALVAALKLHTTTAVKAKRSCDHRHWSGVIRILNRRAPKK